MKLVIKLNFQDLVGQVDKDGTGSIDFPEFLQMMTLKYEEENAEDEIRTAFQVFDTVRIMRISFIMFVDKQYLSSKLQNGNGFINRYELSAVMNNIGEQVTGDEIQVGNNLYIVPKHFHLAVSRI